MGKRGKGMSARNGPRVNIRALDNKGLTRNTACFFADSSGNDQGAREFSKEAGLLSVQKAPELGQTAECGGEQLGAEDPTRTNLEEITAGHPHPPSL